ncbi:hypothetical protein [Micromonospora sp. CPCC 206061]|uniref:hypothetical protein n=1 Tax=Micromonospora sp. CPCC 206061 TaxID=3122410 RepID=UPI002FEFE2EA
MDKLQSKIVSQLLDASNSFIRTGSSENWEPGPVKALPEPGDPTNPLGVWWESFILTVALQGDTPEVHQRILAAPFESLGFQTVFEAFKASQLYAISAARHIAAVAHLLSSDSVGIQPVLTASRAVAESSARAYWLADLEINGRERARRWVNNELVELHHLRSFSKAEDRKFVTEREKRANDLGRLLDFPRSSSKEGKPYFFGERPPSITGLMEACRPGSSHSYAMASSVLHANTFILKHLGSFDWVTVELDEATEQSRIMSESELRSVAISLKDSVALFGQSTVALIEQFGWHKEDHYMKFIELLVTLMKVVEPNEARALEGDT